MGEVALHVERLSVTIGKQPILRDVSLEVTRGACLGVVGPSGEGKTTLLRAIAGFVPVAHGWINLFGKLANRLLPEERGVSMLFQEPVLFNNLTPEQNAVVGMGPNTKKEDHVRKVHELLHTFHLRGDVLKRRVGQLSGGERQRAALVRTFANARELLLLDEPLKSSVNVSLRWELLRAIRELIRKGNTTAIVVTHDFEEAAYFADSIVAIVHGVASKTLSPSDFYLCPPTQDVARLSGPTNELDAVMFLDRVQREDGCPVQLTGTPLRRDADARCALFRPDRARIVTSRHEFVVTSLAFLGHSRTAILRPARNPGGKAIEVTVPHGDGVEVGASVGVDLDTSAVLLYDAMGDLVAERA